MRDIHINHLNIYKSITFYFRGGQRAIEPRILLLSHPSSPPSTPPSSTLIRLIGLVFIVVMPTFPPVPGFPRPSISPQLSKTDNCCSRTERCCWTFATWLPIAIVYIATLWAVYVNVYLISLSFTKGFTGIIRPFTC